MRKPVEKILIILFVIVLLPAIFFSVYEINSLNENEKVIYNVYRNELKAALVSINIYTNDIVKDWLEKLSLIVAEQGLNGILEKDQSIKQFLKLNSNIKTIILGSDVNINMIAFYSQPGKYFSDTKIGKMIEIIRLNELNIKNLLNSNQNGLFKTGMLKLEIDSSNELILFPLNYTKDLTDFCGIIIDTDSFLKTILKPELVIAAQNDFIITIIKNETGELIYSTGDNGDSEIEQKESLSLLPQFSIGIMMKGQTISELVKDRNNRTLILIVFVDILLLIGLWYAVRNIKEEIELTKMKADFIANVSHELRTPLSLISLFAETLVLGRAPSPEKQKEYQKIILDETSRLSRIVNKILSFYEIEGNKKTYHFKQLDLNEIVRKVFDTYSYQLENSGFRYDLKICDNIAMIEGDEESLTEAFINLVDNSMKYSKDRKEIEIETVTSDEFVYLKIKDNGIGISAHNMKKIFDKFYRIQNGFVHETKGAGLGLSIVKSIVTAHKGEIKVQSREGEGSCFELIFKRLEVE